MLNTIYVEVDGAQLVVNHAGQGKAVVFLHAGVADRRMWSSQSELSEKYHTIAYDRRGFGETISEDLPFSHVEDLCKILDHLEITELSLVGCSMGGRVSIDFALAYPERVHKLILVAPAISGEPNEHIFSDTIQTLLDALDKAEEKNDLGRVNSIEAHLWLDGPESKEGRVKGEMRDLFFDMNNIALNKPELTKQKETTPAFLRLSEISAPTLVIHGDLDFPYIKQRCEYISKTIPNARGRMIPNTAHLPNLEKSSEFNSILEEFLN